MTEFEMAVRLGLVPEPIENRLPLDVMIKAEMTHLKHIFEITRRQRQAIGVVNDNLWVELLPWHSLN